ncbi:MAG: DUF4854 domain-containing protein [Eubacterium sp.]|nr:DUF4854 domain-containing protein [Eubacterium sp.]
MRRSKIVSVLLVVVTLVGCMAAVTACKPKEEEKVPTTLEEFLAESDSGIEELAEINQSLSNENMEGKVEVKENTITMAMTLTQSIDKKYFDKMEDALDDMIAKQGSSFRDAVKSLEEESGVSGITMEIVLFNADGTEICRKTV